MKVCVALRLIFVSHKWVRSICNGGGYSLFIWGTGLFTCFFNKYDEQSLRFVIVWFCFFSLFTDAVSSTKLQRKVLKSSKWIAVLQAKANGVLITHTYVYFPLYSHALKKLSNWNTWTGLERNTIKWGFILYVKILAAEYCLLKEKPCAMLITSSFNCSFKKRCCVIHLFKIKWENLHRNKIMLASVHVCYFWARLLQDCYELLHAHSKVTHSIPTYTARWQFPPPIQHRRRAPIYCSPRGLPESSRPYFFFEQTRAHHHPTKAVLQVFTSLTRDLLYPYSLARSLGPRDLLYPHDLPTRRTEYLLCLTPTAFLVGLQDHLCHTNLRLMTHSASTQSLTSANATSLLPKRDVLTSVLSLGMNFALTPKSIAIEEMIQSVEPTLRRLDKTVADDVQVKMSEELLAQRNIKRDSSIHILSADKGNATVIMDRSQYTSKVSDILSSGSYRPLKKNSIPSIDKRFARKLLALYRADALTIQLYRHLRPSSSSCPSFFGQRRSTN